METYKKKPLRFSGFAKVVRKGELETIRKSSRDTRYSFLRPITDVEDSPKENIQKSQVPKCSKIPVPGNRAQQSRIEMLKKFQEEKLLKKNKEQLLKKPVFKCGSAAPKPLSSLSHNLSKIQGMQSFKSQTSNREPQGMKSKNSIVNSSKLTTTAIKPAVTRVKQATSIKPAVTQVKQATSIKPATSQIKQATSIKPVVSKIKQATGIKPVTVKSKTDSIASSSKPKPPITGIKPVTSKIKQATGIKPVTLKSKIVPIPTRNTFKPAAERTDLKPNQNKDSIRSRSNLKPPPQVGKPDPKQNKAIISSYNLKPPVVEKINPKQSQNKISKPAVIPKPTFSRLPNKEKNTTDKTKVVVKPSKLPEIKQTSHGNSAIKSKVPDKKPSPKVSEETCISSSKDVTFSCQLSMIEPVETEKRSFAPEGFLFCPRSEWYSSYLLDEAPTAIFARLKAAETRTSTPISKSHSNCEGKSPNSHEGSFIQNKAIEETLEGNVSAETKEDLLEANLKTSNFPHPTIPKVQIVGDTLVHKMEKSVVDEVTSSEQPLSSLNSVENKLEVASPEVEPLETLALGKESPKILDNEVVASPEVERLETLALGKESPKILDNEVVASDVAPLTLPEICLLENKQLKQASPETVFSKAADIIDPDLNITSPPKQSQDNFSENCTSVTKQLLKLPVHVSPLTTFSPVEVDSSESKDVIDTGVKTRSHYRRNVTPFLVRINDGKEKSPIVQEPTPIVHRKKRAILTLTPRRSARLARKSTFGSVDNILDEQPSFVYTPPDDDLEATASGLTSDFQKLRLDLTCAPSPDRKFTTREASRVSLLFTPPRRKSRKSVLKQDLMSFSPLP